MDATPASDDCHEGRIGTMNLGGQLHLQKDGRDIDFRLTRFDSIIQQHLYTSLPLAAWLALRLLHLAARQKRFEAGALEDIVLSSHDGNSSTARVGRLELLHREVQIIEKYPQKRMRGTKFPIALIKFLTPLKNFCQARRPCSVFPSPSSPFSL